MASLQKPPKLKKRRRMPIVGAVMTSFPYFVDVDDTGTTLERMMEEHNIRHLPVQENGKVVGIVSERDLHHHFKRAASTSVKDKVLAREMMITYHYIVPLDSPVHKVDVETD